MRQGENVLYSRMGGTIRLVRLASADDHRACGETPIRKSDRQRIADQCRAVFRFDGVGTDDDPRDDGRDRIADVGYIRADRGFAEVSEAFAAIGAEWAKPKVQP